MAIYVQQWDRLVHEWLSFEMENPAQAFALQHKNARHLAALHARPGEK
jgi:hypothetical protein